ncbi:ce5772e5-ee9c-4982-b8c8-a2fcdb14c3d3 [Thermothielavioides terrestris]|uniref:Ce5772e5-ee9c-4982-b8c8-a2fcdb14c3d3 n=1 Tax=Thermothielavioides terrestris TaxID=2587410 RepID=A0A3S4BP88_9PEZI|nr:ce5772e5-ee9c-4982-b8c8-a2fcdb14c3d3 [Thermothielavioides terrestris]
MHESRSFSDECRWEVSTEIRSLPASTIFNQIKVTVSHRRSRRSSSFGIAESARLTFGIKYMTET